jgi:hypothetical protein
MEGAGAGGRNDPSVVCTYELKKKKLWLFHIELGRLNLRGAVRQLNVDGYSITAKTHCEGTLLIQTVQYGFLPSSVRGSLLTSSQCTVQVCHLPPRIGWAYSQRVPGVPEPGVTYPVADPANHGKGRWRGGARQVRDWDFIA